MDGEILYERYSVGRIADRIQYSLLQLLLLVGEALALHLMKMASPNVSLSACYSGMKQLQGD
jgi:hypothetical protein